MDGHYDLYDRHLVGHQRQQTVLHNQHLAVEDMEEKFKAIKYDQLQGQEGHRRILQETTMIKHGGDSGGGPSSLTHSCLSSVPTLFATDHAAVVCHHEEQPPIVRKAAFSHGSNIPQQQPLLCATRTSNKSLKEQLLRAPLSSAHDHHHLLNSAAASSATSIVVSRVHFSPSFGPAPHAYVHQVSASSSLNNDTCQEQQDTLLRRQALLQRELEDLRQCKAVLMNNYELRHHKQPSGFSLPPQVLPKTTGTFSHDLQKQHEREYQLQKELERQKQIVMELEAENARLSSRRSPQACFDPAASSSICLIHQQDLFSHQEEIRQLQQKSQLHYATSSFLATVSAIPFRSKTSLATNKSRMLVQAHLPPSIRDEFAKQRQLQISALSSYPQHAPRVCDVLREARRVLQELPSGAHTSLEIEDSQPAVHQQVLESARRTSRDIAQSKKAKFEKHQLTAPTVCTGVPQQAIATAVAQDHEDEEEVPLLPRSESKLDPKKEKQTAAKKKKESKHESNKKPDLSKSVGSSDDFNAPEDTNPAAGGLIDEEGEQEIKEEHAANFSESQKEVLQKVHKRNQQKEEKVKCKDLQWKYSYDQLKAYKDQYGDCIVPRGFVPNPPLGSWVAEQRKQYKRVQLGKNSTLTEERIQMLEELGFAWNAQTAAWDGHFKNLVKFHAKHGHCHVSLNNMDFPKLGLWVKEQRRHYSLMRTGCRTHISAERIKQLENLGFCWDTQEASWLVRFLELSKYKEEHGDCCPPPNTELGSWIRFQCRQYQRLVDKEVGHHVLTQMRIDKLNSISFDWTMVCDDSKKGKPKNMSMMKVDLSSSLQSKSKKRPRSPAASDDNQDEEYESYEEEQENADFHPSGSNNSNTVRKKVDEEGDEDYSDKEMLSPKWIKEKKQPKFVEALLYF